MQTIVARGQNRGTGGDGAGGAGGLGSLGGGNGALSLGGGNGNNGGYGQRSYAGSLELGGYKL